MAKALVFEDEAAAKAAFELGKVSFRCSVCGRVHRSGSKTTHECLKSLQQKLDSFSFESQIDDFRLMSSQYSTWRYWGREKELLESVALKSSIYRFTKPTGLFVWSSNTVEDYMLALPADYIQRLNERNMLQVYEKSKEVMNGSFKRLFNRGLELEHFFNEVKGPNLPLPLIVNFASSQLSFDGKNFTSFMDFFWPRIVEAAKSLKEGDEMFDLHISNVTMRSAYRKLVPDSDSCYSMFAGYFIPQGAYVIVGHRGLIEEDQTGREYRYMGCYIFYLRDYERPEFVEMFLESEPLRSFENLISRLVEKAKTM